MFTFRKVEDISEFSSYLESQNPKYEDDFWVIDFWMENISEKIQKYNVFYIEKGSKKYGFLYVTHYENKSFVHLSYFTGMKQDELINSASKFWTDSFFASFEFYQTESPILKISNNNSSLRSSSSYCEISGYHTNGDVNALRDIFEKKFVWMPDDDISSLAFLDFSTKELKEVIKKAYDPIFYNPYENTENGHYAFPGFHYFNSDDLCTKCANVHYLIAQDPNTKKCAGVISYGVWDDEPDKISISYIDVSQGARGKGVARLLINALNKELKKWNPKLVLRLGHLSEMGKLTHIDKVFKEEINSLKVLDAE